MTATTADAKFWDRIAEKYAAQPVADVPAYERKKEITRELLTPESTILDVGCGTGSLALELSPSVAHVHAVDISAEMIRIANGKKAARGADNVTFHQGSLDAPLPFEPEQFDGVCAFNILHLVADRQRALRKIFEVVRPGGVFVSSNVCLGEGWMPYGALLTVMRWLGKAPKVQIYGRETAMREMREAGFVDVAPRDVGCDDRVAFVVAHRPRR